MAQDYWIDIMPPKGAYGHVGDYEITGAVQGKPHHHHRRHDGRPLFYTVDYGIVPVVTDDSDIPDNIAGGFFSDLVSAVNPVNVVKKVAHMGGDAIHTINKAAHLAGKVAGKIPVVGKPLKAVLNLNPVVAAGNIVSKIAHGERLDRVALDAGKGQIAAIRDVAPYAKMVASYVPGVGTGIAAAIAAGTALADGRTISDAVLDAVAAGVPSGLGKNVFSAVRSIAEGNSIKDTAMHAALANLPSNVQQAANIAIAASGGKNVREAVLQAIRTNVPPDAQKALDVGTALMTGRNIQSHVANAVMNTGVLNKLAQSVKIPAILAKVVPKEPLAAKGFKSAIALVSHTGVTPTALAAVRLKMAEPERRGFDAGLKAFVNHAAPSMTSLVRGGVVIRGHWRAARKGEKCVTGRLIQNGKVIHGAYVRG